MGGEQRGLGGKPVHSLTSDEILQCLRRVEERGAHESAHRIRQYIHAIYEYAVHAGQADANPTPAPGALAPAKKAHFASINEPKGVGALIRAIRSDEGTEQPQAELATTSPPAFAPGDAPLMERLRGRVRRPTAKPARRQRSQAPLSRSSRRSRPEP